MSISVPNEDEGDPLLGKVFDERYRIEERLGEGGLGRVYKTRHLTLGKFFALKVLLTKYESIPVLKQRFQREAEALAALSHPNIVTVSDFGVVDDNPYIVMELLEGRDLSHFIAEPEPLVPKRVFEIIRQILRALAYAHQQGLVHRDLKPHNVFVRVLDDGSDHVEVLDFGLARFIDEAANNSPKLTRVGALIGTPAYMAPEQASGQDVDARADLYAVGCVLFECLTGRRVFERPNPGEILRAHLLHQPPTIMQADPGLTVSHELESLVLRSLAKSPAERFQTAKEMVQALDNLELSAAVRTGPRPPREQPISMVAPTQGRASQTRADTPRAMRDGSASDDSMSSPRSRNAIYAGVGCGLLATAAIAVAGVLYVYSTKVDDSLPPPDVAGVDPSPSAPAPGRPEARNPFDEMDPALTRLHERAAQPTDRADPDRDFLATIQRWGEGRENDPRIHLLQAHLFARHARINPIWGAHSVEQYQLAYIQDSSVRGDPDMLPDLLEHLGDRDFAPEVSDFIVAAYGPEALERVQAARDHEENAATRVRYDALLARLNSQSSSTPTEMPL